MHQWLSKLLENQHITYDELTADEKKTYNEWATILSAPEVSLDDLKKFIPGQLAHLDSEQNDYRNTKDKDLYLKASIRNLKMIHAFILGPEQRKKWLETHIEGRVKGIN